MAGVSFFGTVPVGRDKQLQRMARVRPDKQRAAIVRVLRSADFDFACNNPLDPGVSPDYRGPVNVLYFTKGGRLKVVHIGVDGRILRTIHA